MMDTDCFAQRVAPQVKTVLIVEDDEAIGEVLIEVIQQETSYQVVLARNGFQALNMLETVKPDLLILDYGLPGMSGLEFYDTIHLRKALEQLPVLFVSAEAASIQEKVEVRRLWLLEKPFEIVDLLTIVKQLLS
jgi:DNA-binding response OmpR family regulator